MIRSAGTFVRRLERLSSEEQRAKYERTFRREGDVVIGVRMGDVFDLAAEHTELPLAEIEQLLESPIHEVRVGALSIMAKSAAAKRTTDDRRRALFDLYLRRHDRIDDWDLVDVAAVHVVGRWLADRPRDVLYDLARSDDWCERRTAIVSTLFFIRRGDVDDTFGIAALLVDDPVDLIRKATGGVLREAGKQDEDRLVRFLETHAPAMPRVMLRYATERLPEEQRRRLRALPRVA